MGDVLRYTGETVRRAPRGQCGYHADLPEGVTRLVQPPREPIRMTTRGAALLLAAILAEVGRDMRQRIAGHVERLLDETPDDADLRAADQLLRAAKLTALYESTQP